MIEIKNVTQIGTPREEDKIYIENLAYEKLREENHQDKRVFVLMGHTERMEGRYATFIEAVVPVREMTFSGIVPQWNNGLWSQVFKEIKRLYEDMIIVGWAIEARGMRPAMTPDLERVHREHFGGVHQLALLMDSMEQEETFYIYKENKLIPKDGFFIYYRARKNKKPELEVIDLNIEPEMVVKEPVANVEFQTTESMPFQRGRYRQMLSEQKAVSEKESSNGGLAIAVAMLVFVIAVGAYENRESIFGNFMQPSTEAGAPVDTESEDESEEIPVEVIPGTENTGQ